VNAGNENKTTLSLEQALLRANALHSAGRLNEAENIYQRILTAAPNEPNALCYLGVMAVQRKQYEKAISLLERSSAVAPQNPLAQNNLGVACAALKDTQRAMAHYRAAIDTKPDYVAPRKNLGHLLIETGAYAEAYNMFNQMIGETPTSAPAHLGAGKAAWKLGDFALAKRYLQKTISLDSNLVEAKTLFIELLATQSEIGQALRLSEEAAAAHPNAPEFPLARARLYVLQSEFKKAAKSYHDALAIDQTNADALAGLGQVYSKNNRPEEAFQYFSQATKAAPNDSLVMSYYAVACIQYGKLKQAFELSRRAIESDPTHTGVRNTHIYVLNHDPHATAKDVYGAALRNAEVLTRDIRPFSKWRAGGSSRPLRVGLLSADFRRHVVAYFLRSIVKAIDREKIALFAYHASVVCDDVTEELKESFAAFRPARSLSDHALAQRIYDDEIDILVDLSGFTSGNRLPVLAFKAAPIQATWLGYSGTTGLNTVDYVFCDPIELPAEEEEFFTETPWRLPATRHCYTPPAEDIAVGPPPAIENGHVTFGVFQRHSKINDDVIGCFARVLNATPKSRLAFRGLGFDDEHSRAETRSAFEALDVDPDRILFFDRVPYLELFKYYNRIDIALSPFPWPGVTTFCEGCWMGVPFVYQKGKRFLERAGDSFLRLLDMQDWLAADVDHYVQIAAEKARDLDGLIALRKNLRARFMASPLCDARAFARDLENAFLEMHNRRQM